MIKHVLFTIAVPALVFAEIGDIAPLETRSDMALLETETREISPFASVTEEASTPSIDQEIAFLTEEFETDLSKENSSQEPLAIEIPSQEPLHALPDTLSVSDAPSEEIQVVSRLENSSATPLSFQETSPSSFVEKPIPKLGEPLSIDLVQAFRGSPIIYSILFSLSVVAFGLFLYTWGAIQLVTRSSTSLSRQLHSQLMNNQFQEALGLCREKKTLLPQMLQIGIQSRHHGLPTIVESMKLEGKRSTVFFWQKLGLLNDIAIIAPMLGLLGTVLGMFYAFYDVNRSIESVSTLFDGLGISVGTTVAGLIVTILSLSLHSIVKYRLVRSLAKVESEAQSLALLLDDKTHIHKG